MTTKLIWRLGKLPTPMEISTLVNDKVITQEEAREILFRKDDERDADSLKSEITFLRGLVEKLSSGAYHKVTEYIYQYQTPNTGPWYQPYVTWCSSATTPNLQYYSGSGGATYTTTSSGTNTLNMMNAVQGISSSDQLAMSNMSAPAQPEFPTNFSEIKTF